MITIEGIEYYEACDLCEPLDLKYPTVIWLLRKNNIPKYENKYIVSKEQLEQLLNRENRNLKKRDWAIL